ncbi:hypothetical protein AAG906_035358 [Vitis piasezkii]
MGDLHYFLSIEALSMPQGLLLTHHRCIWDLLTCTKLDGAKDVTIQLSTPTSFTLHDSSPNSYTIQLRFTSQQASKRDDRTSTATYIVYLGDCKATYSARPRFSITIFIMKFPFGSIDSMTTDSDSIRFVTLPPVEISSGATPSVPFISEFLKAQIPLVRDAVH